MSFKTNRRTRGIFPTDEEVHFDRRRYTCHICQAMFGEDLPSEQAEMEARITGREPAGTPLSSFVSRAELQEHIKRLHGGQRLPTQKHRQLGRIAPKPKERQEVETEGGLMGTATVAPTEGESDDLVGDADDTGDILGEEKDKEEIFAPEGGREDKGLLDE